MEVLFTKFDPIRRGFNNPTTRTGELRDVSIRDSKLQMNEFQVLMNEDKCYSERTEVWHTPTSKLSKDRLGVQGGSQSLDEPCSKAQVPIEVAE